MPSGIASILVVGLVVALAGALAVLGLVIGLTGGDELNNRLQLYAVIPESNLRSERGRNRAGLVRLRLRLNTMLSALASEKLNLQLARANWRVTVPEFLLIRLGLTLACLLLAWLYFRAPLSGFGLAAIAYLIPGVLVQRSVSRRQSQFAKQLTDVLVLINGAVRAGHSLLQALEVVMRELKPPASEEFGRVVREVGLGLSLSEALRNLSARMQNNDLDLVVSAIEIQYKVGGNLATMLTAVTETMRDRIRLFGEVRVLTTQQRYSSYLLSVLPFFVGGLMFLMNPAYMRRLFEPQIICIPIGALFSIVLGSIVIKRITKIEI